MNYINISENEKIVLDEKYIAKAKQILLYEPDLHFSICENSIVFDSYIIGSLKIDDLIININSRNKAFTLSKAFEMMLYNSKIKSNISSTFDVTTSSGLSVLPSLFIQSCTRLVKNGLTGGYENINEYSKEAKGNIDFSTFQKSLVALNGLKVSYDNYSLNVLQNSIIKSALIKCELFVQQSEIFKIEELLKSFGSVDEVVDCDFEESEILNFFSSNSNYKETLRLGLMILKDLKLKINKGDIEWCSFLTNSNDLFEAFARNIIKNNINEKVEKWEAPKEFASITHETNVGYKSFVPDILINYSPSTNTASAVVDAKNKSFDPKATNLAELVSSGDLYQLLFYLRQLKTKIGALIYPCGQDFAPIKVSVNDSNDYRIFLLSINISKSIVEMENKIKKDIYEVLLKI